tara:strand:- start:87 stop:224 length:138 start_codon:yes stop_codon:yes gene_type:complete
MNIKKPKIVKIIVIIILKSIGNIDIDETLKKAYLKISIIDTIGFK